MAPLSAVQARTRPRRSPVKVNHLHEDRQQRDELASLESDDEPPIKRLRTSRSSQPKEKWVPGGRGGGGRRNHQEHSEMMPATPNTNDDYPAPRTRRRDTSRRTNTTSRFSARSRNRAPTRPRYSTAAAAAAATHGDGYKPREERGWEEYHPDLDLDSVFAVVISEEVDGLIKTQPMGPDGAIGGLTENTLAPGPKTPIKRRPGRPHRTQSSMLQSLLTPEAPKIVPTPAPNPRERLTLPKPSYRILDPFQAYEQKDIAAVNFVNQSMANVGYQESELYIRPERTFVRQMEGSADEDLDLSPDLVLSGGNSAIGGGGVGRVEYDMDEQDVKWLEAFNRARTDEGTAAIKPAIFEITMTKIEKEWHALEKRIPKPNPKAPQTQRPRSSSAAAVNGEPLAGEEPDSKCAICDDGDCENANAIVFCDGCDLAVHQECYGVPYIPEGQWLCRKCQLVGSARPSCIFCPNEGGAFKQTNNSKWAHLLCANWIPEVTIGNPSLMEPITDVEKVPNSRWKLNCYICRQDMGASIQCSDGRCYEPFHLTCARQAGLYLRMKTGGGQNTLMDPSLLRAYCHKHTPADWRLEHNTDKAFDHAVKFFKQHFHGQVWADSRASALAISDSHDPHSSEKGLQKLTLTNKKGQKPKTVWRLPSGAPVIPDVILRSIEESLVRFAVPKKKEYVAETCKYWTLKREARRGAALLKRLQLQMDTFSSFEATRRDYKAQGAAGRARLERRIAFAENLAKDLDRIRTICEVIKTREAEKLKDAALLKEIVDTVYFPIPLLLAPIMERAFKLDPRGVYREALTEIQSRLSCRYFTTVASFFSDFARIFQDDIGFDASDQANLQALYARPDSRPDDVLQRERRTLARRIVKAVYPALEDALKKEAELNGRPFAQQMKEMDDLWFSRRLSAAAPLDTSNEDALMIDNDVDGPIESPEVQTISIEDQQLVKILEPQATNDATNQHVLIVRSASANTPPASTNGIIKPEMQSSDVVVASNGEVITAQDLRIAVRPIEPPTPPMSTEGQNNITGPSTAAPESVEQSQSQSQPAPLDKGGIPWYVEQFDPVGTTIFEERWTGPDVLRDMSEELSDMDEETLLEMGGGDIEMMDDMENIDHETEEEEDEQQDIIETVRRTSARNANAIANSNSTSEVTGSKGGKKQLNKKLKRKANNWSERSFRHRRQR